MLITILEIGIWTIFGILAYVLIQKAIKLLMIFPIGGYYEKTRTADLALFIYSIIAGPLMFLFGCYAYFYDAPRIKRKWESFDKSFIPKEEDWVPIKWNIQPFVK